jgi:hypothetical protein
MEKKSTINAYRFIKPLLNIHHDNLYAFALLAFLCHAAKNETGESWHGHASITYATGMHDQAIRSATKALVKMGVISYQVRGTVTNRETKLYTVHYDRLAELEREGKAFRKEFIRSQRVKKAKWQRKWRGGSKAEDDVERVANSTSSHDVERVTNATNSDVDLVANSHVECVGNSSVECAGDTRTTKYELGKNQPLINNQLEAGVSENSGSKGGESTVMHDQPTNRAVKIRHARELIGTWEYELQQARQNGSPHVRLCETRLEVWRKQLDSLLAAPPELAADGEVAA